MFSPLISAVPLVLTCLLLMPWLNPVASGPSPSVLPWVMAAACGVVLWVWRARLTERLVAGTWLLAATLSAGMGLLQYFGHTLIWGGWVHTTVLGDAFANLRQRNQFATLTSIGLIALLWFESRKLKISDEDRPMYWTSWVLKLPFMLALAVGNASSSSRTGMLQWFVILGLTVGWCPKGNRRTLAICSVSLVFYAIATLALPGLLEFFTGIPRGGLLARFAEDPGCGSRRVLWANVMHLIAQKPWAGWGWGELDYAHFVTLYPGERFCEILDNAHNLPLHLAVELGVPVACLSLGLLTWWLARNRPWAEKNPTRQMAWAVLAVIGLHSLLEYPLWYGPFQLAVGLCVLLLWRTRPENLNGVADKLLVRFTGIGLGAVSSAVAVLLLAVLGMVAWDYWRVSQLYLLPAHRAVAYRDHTLEKVRNSWFFQDQVQFAELTTVTLNEHNAAEHYAQALRLLHFSPEPRVIEAVMESAVMLGKDSDALYFLQRYQAAFPQEHAVWVARSARFKVP